MIRIRDKTDEWADFDYGEFDDDNDISNEYPTKKKDSIIHLENLTFKVQDKQYFITSLIQSINSLTQFFQDLQINEGKIQSIFSENNYNEEQSKIYLNDNSEKLMDKYSKQTPTKNDDLECCICAEKAIHAKDLINLGCKHFLCEECFLEHAQSILDIHGQGCIDKMNCASECGYKFSLNDLSNACNMQMKKDKFMKVKEIKERYMYFFIEDMIAKQQNIQRCMTCDLYIVIPEEFLGGNGEIPFKNLLCDCGAFYC